jgi:hypothetical protein
MQTIIIDSRHWRKRQERDSAVSTKRREFWQRFSAEEVY